jgi:hypothetical protein
MTARDARAWAIIALTFIPVLAIANDYATTGTGYPALAVATIVTFTLIMVWARRRHLEETRAYRARRTVRVLDEIS